jgi:uncharacterized protein with ATP-grasp and redox domains
MMHSSDYFWSEVYSMHEAMMRLGVKKIYYREDPYKERVKSQSKKELLIMSKIETNREKKRKALA